MAGGREKRRQLCVFESVCTLVWEERQWRHCLSPQQSLEDGWCEEHQLILASAAFKTAMDTRDRGRCQR